MKTFRLSRIGLAILWASTTMVFGEDPAGREIPISPAELWQSAEGIKLSSQDGILRIDYDAAVKTARRKQEKTLLETSIFIGLQKPVDIEPGMERVVFEARGQDGSAESRTGTVFLRPVVEDEKGERFSYEPFRVDHLKEGNPQAWAEWTTRPFLTSEAGGAMPSIYEAYGGDHNNWPDGHLRFVGFDLRLRMDTGGKNQGQKTGTISVGSVRLEPTRPPQEPPAEFADAFLEAKGHYTATFEVRSAFQGPPVAESRTEIDFDPASERSRRQKLAIPRAGEFPNTWVRYQFVTESGQVAAEGEMRWQNDLPPAKEAPAPLEAKKAPAVGWVRINPERSTNGVYAPGEPLDLVMRVFQTKPSEQARPAVLEWTLKSYGYGEKLGEGRETLSTGEEPFKDLVLHLKAPPSQTAFRVDYRVLGTGDVEIDRGSYVIGIGGTEAPIEPYHGRPGLPPDRWEIRKTPYNRITFHPGNGTIKNADEMVQRFRDTVAEAEELTTHITVMLDLADFEILPGVYDFSLLDRIMDAAADRRFGITIRLAHLEKVTPYRWLPITKVRDFDGSIIGGQPLYKAVSLADKSYLETWVRAFHALHDRYREHPGFEGYYLMLPNGEMTIPDEVWHGKIADFSWAAAAAFRSYLQDKLHLSLDDLNARWGTHFGTWAEVIPPQPDWSIGARPDLRRSWMDFCRFKIDLSGQWSPVIAQRIREFDRQHIIMAYGTPDQFAVPEGTEPTIDYAHNGGNHTLIHEGEYVKAWDGGKGVGWITEPHHPHRWAAYGDPAERGWVLDWSVFVMLAQAGGGGANLHVYLLPNSSYSLVAHYGGEYAFDRVEQYKPILRELHDFVINSPIKQVAAYHDPDTLFAKHRTTFGGRANDLTRWFGLLTADALPWEAYQAEHEKNYRIVFANPLDEVLSGTSIETLDRVARQGGTVVLTANTGRYCSDAPEKTYPLLAKLGIPAPAGQYDIFTPKVQAEVDAKSRSLLGRDQLDFYSQGDMRRDLQDPAIGANYLQWPYRWLPESDYFGHFSKNQIESGEILARFPDGGVALSRHAVGKGWAIVFWGTPDMTHLQGLLGKIADLAGVVNPQKGNAVPYMLEGRNRILDRHYALLFNEDTGTFTQKLPETPDGTWFVDDMVSGERFGTYTGKELRETGLTVSFQKERPPLKVVRMYRPDAKLWIDKYRQPPAPESAPPKSAP